MRWQASELIAAIGIIALGGGVIAASLLTRDKPALLHAILRNRNQFRAALHMQPLEAGREVTRIRVALIGIASCGVLIVGIGVVVLLQAL